MAEPRGPNGQGERNGRGEPQFRIVAGHPCDEEAAAVAAVLSLLVRRDRAPAAAPAAAPRSGWADRRRRLAPVPTPGPGGWRRSALPH